MRTKSLKDVIMILSVGIAMLVVVVIDVSQIIRYKNLFIAIVTHIALTVGISQLIYFISIGVAKLMTKIHLYKEVRHIQKLNKSNEKIKQIKKDIETRKRVANET